jgi:cytoskeletal protein RodZ
MFFKLLHKVRKMPEHKRQLLTLFVSIVVTAIIAIFWAINFIPKANEALSKTSAEDLLGPFNNVTDAITSTADSKTEDGTGSIEDATNTTGMAQDLTLTSTSTTSTNTAATSTFGAGTSSKKLLE